MKLDEIVLGKLNHYLLLSDKLFQYANSQYQESLKMTDAIIRADKKGDGVDELLKKYNDHTKEYFLSQQDLVKSLQALELIYSIAKEAGVSTNLEEEDVKRIEMQTAQNISIYRLDEKGELIQDLPEIVKDTIKTNSSSFNKERFLQDLRNSPMYKGE